MDLKRLTLITCTDLPRLEVSLQKLVDDASDGSSITIDLGNYVLSEPLHINKNITLVGSPFAAFDAQGDSQILKIDNPKASVSIENFLFMHGSGDYGGAITSQAQFLTIKDCRFLDNLAEYGAGIYQKDGDLQVVDSLFENNNATRWGAAIYGNNGNVEVESSKFTQNPGCHVICFNGTETRQVQVLIKDCNVSNNPGPYDMHGSGGAIACENSTTLIDRCTIKGNKALVITPTFLDGTNAGLFFAGSNVVLNDSIIEGNEALYMAAIAILGDSKVEINRCNIKGNHARSVLLSGKYIGGDGAGIVADTNSEVTTNDVTLEGNIADGDAGAIWSFGKLNLNEGTAITKSIARRYSALNSLKSGIVNISKNTNISDNIDTLQPSRPIHSEGILNME